MRYRIRHLEKKLAELARYFKVVLVTGARQVGKTTLLNHVFPEVKSVVFDPVQDLYGADQVGHGLVVYAGAETYRLAEFATAVPWNAQIG